MYHFIEEETPKRGFFLVDLISLVNTQVFFVFMFNTVYWIRASVSEYIKHSLLLALETM